MLVIKVELWSAITGAHTEIARAMIANVGGDEKKGDYNGVTYRGRSAIDLTQAMHDNSFNKIGQVKGYPRLSKHVWNLVARMLVNMGYK